MGFDHISFTTDYGLADGFPAACEGVIARIAPRARIIHVSHLVPRHDIRRGAAILAQTVPSLPPSVHLAVVDPGVGTDRRGVLLVTDGSVFVGPDNGLLVPAADAAGIRAAFALTGRPASATFHGRDVFAPAAAHLAAGLPPSALGRSIDPATLVRLPVPTVVAEAGRLVAEVLGADTFGNVQLAATTADLSTAGLARGDQVNVHCGERIVPAVIGSTFADADPGAAVLLIDSAGLVALAVNGGSAATLTSAAGGVVVAVSRV